MYLIDEGVDASEVTISDVADSAIREDNNRPELGRDGDHNARHVEVVEWRVVVKDSNDNRARGLDARRSGAGVVVGNNRDVHKHLVAVGIATGVSYIVKRSQIALLRCPFLVSLV